MRSKAPSSPSVSGACQYTGARPELGPVGEALVPGKVFLVDQGVRRRRVCYAVGRVPDLDRGFDQLRAAPEVGVQARPELSRGYASRFVYRTEEVAAGSACVSASA